MDYYDPSLQAALSAVPIPPDAQPAAGPDAEITIYQPSSDTLWKMFDMRRAPRPTAVPIWASWPQSGCCPGTLPLRGHRSDTKWETTPSPIPFYQVSAGGTVALRWNGPVGAIACRINRGERPRASSGGGKPVARDDADRGAQLRTDDDGSSVPAASRRLQRTRRARPGSGTPSGAGGSLMCRPIPATTATSPVRRADSPSRRAGE